MNKIILGLVIIVLVGSFTLTTVAAMNGAGLVSSGSGNPSSRNAVWFPIFVGGGPGSGK